MVKEFRELISRRFSSDFTDQIPPELEAKILAMGLVLRLRKVWPKRMILKLRSKARSAKAQNSN